uniref:Uncharacterized protein n=1 Tax=Romanomermis culicivorax TaxID=13658 RepID=A0A915IHH3_ROMCU
MLVSNKNGKVLLWLPSYIALTPNIMDAKVPGSYYKKMLYFWERRHINKYLSPLLLNYKQPLRQSKSTSFLLKLTKEDSRQQITNIEETIEQVARKFINSIEDNDQAVNIEAGDHMNQMTQTSSGSSSLDKITTSAETNYLWSSNSQLTRTIA